MMFMELDHGAILRKESGLDTPKMVRLVIGNPLIMKEMAKRVPDAGLYAPVTVLVDLLSLCRTNDPSIDVRRYARPDHCLAFLRKRPVLRTNNREEEEP
jgi:hypothetical protein